jgi:putative Mg2+ transporter-C (MgtC) family protein
MNIIEYNHLTRILIASLIGLLIGTERAISNKPASFRTFALVSTASCIFTIISIKMSLLSKITDPSRIAAQIVSGVGFVGAGIIYKDNTANSVEGITTAVMIWFTSALGMICGFGDIVLGLVCCLVYILILIFGKVLHILLHGYK